MRFRWLIITPFGSAVEPEVYWRYARSSSVTPGSCQVSAPSVSRSSIASQVAAASAPEASRAPSAIWRVVITNLIPADSAIVSSRGSVRARRLGSGGCTGTA